MTREEKRDLLKGILFTSPWLVGLSVFVIYPVVASFYYSFCYYSVLQPPRFIGLLNYKDLFTDPHILEIAVEHGLLCPVHDTARISDITFPGDAP